jgi:aspartyl aminopeptidase
MKKIDSKKSKSAWSSLEIEDKNEMEKLIEEYKRFISIGKTEREAADYIEAEAKKEGFVDVYEVDEKDFNPNGKYYAKHRGKSMVMINLGNCDLTDGVNIIGAHIDSPRLDLKQNPIYEDGDMALLKTHYYGGIKKYQWTSLPLALHGVVYDSDGNKISISIGEAPEDPVFSISDLLPHLAKDQNAKKMSEAVTGESLNVIIGNMPCEDKDEKKPVKAYILKMIEEMYGISEEDFKVAELEVVPAGKARDSGFDRSMVLGYGQDDRSCSFAAMKAIFSAETYERSAVAIFSDKEEIGSVGNTGMLSSFFENFMAEIIYRTKDQYNELMLRRLLSKSYVFSADVVNGFDPDYSDVSDKINSAYIGRGVSVSKYGGSRGKSNANDSNAEYMSKIRMLLNKENIVWQTAEVGKVDQGGGGTIAYILANKGAEVVDIGLPVISMHAPFELISKVDLYMAYRAYDIFFKEMS